VTASIYLGIGSNVGDRESNLHLALGLMDDNGIHTVQLSPIYETDPIDSPAHAGKFLNLVCESRTSLNLDALGVILKSIEQRLGRKPAPINSPRIIDIDILLYGEAVVKTGQFTVPHPRMIQRAFVLVPLADIAPNLIHPVLRLTVGELLARVPGRRGVHLFSDGGSEVPYRSTFEH